MPQITRTLRLPFLHESRVWVEDHADLATFGIRRAGMTRVSGPRIRMVTDADRQYTHLHVTISGEAEVFVQGKWQTLSPNMAYVNPPNTQWGWRYNRKGKPWEVLYVRLDVDSRSPVITDPEKSFVLKNCFCDDLLSTYQALYRESVAAGRHTVVRCLGELLAFHTRQIMHRTEPTSELADLWMKVCANLRKSWTLDDLSAAAHASPEKLRLLSKDETGRSPIRHVTHLRMQRAAALLLDTTASVEDVASRVGYENSYNFSTAFKRHYGASPREYRKRELS